MSFQGWKRESIRYFSLCSLLFVLGTAAGGSPALQEKSADRWEPAIRKLEEQDKASPPPKNAVLFVGSSSIVRWNLAKWFPDLQAVNRGFGGSQIADSVRYAPRIVLPYEPRVIVFYAGDNDLAGGKSTETVVNDFKAFAKIVRDKGPRTKIVYISIKPSIQRWQLIGKIRATNAAIRAYIGHDERLRFVDVEQAMLGTDGKPRADLFAADGLHLSDAGYQLWTSLLLPHLNDNGKAVAARLRVATCQFPVSKWIAENSGWIRKQMRGARAQQADIVQFPECALSGYAGTDHETMTDFDWERQRFELESILRLANELHLWVILGAAHRLSDGHKPHNSLYVINPEGKIIDRYDKRFCTDGDLEHYSPGDHFVTFDVNGVRCGLLICYDIRFPELYRQYVRRGVRLMFHSFYNARQKAGAIHPKIMPPTAQAHAATNGMFLSVANSCATHSWESLFVTPDGLIEKRLVLDQPGVMINVVDLKKKYYDASAQYRMDAINGKLNSGDVVQDARSNDRTCY